MRAPMQLCHGILAKLKFFKTNDTDDIHLIFQVIKENISFISKSLPYQNVKVTRLKDSRNIAILKYDVHRPLFQIKDYGPWGIHF